MKIGVCCGTDIEKIKYVKALGYDFAESHCQEIVKAEDEKIEAIKAIGFPIIAANCFISLRVVGEEKDEAAIKEYLETLFSKSKKLGLSYLVFGSSAARRIPEGMSLEQGRAEIIDFLKNLVVPMAEKYDLPVAIEPLRPEECNAINTIDDGVEVAKKVDSPYVKVLADVAHMFVQDEAMDKLLQYKGFMLHAHTSNPDPAPETGKKRTYPTVSDAFSQKSFFDSLKAVGVETCSIEADVIDFQQDVKNAYEVLKELR
ncbi:MAG: sugar phosphate isomerase/epimerase [Clostridia bacterium]|nr:sugar phosphate isomerase/epimerase [Clostridia bacterium]